MTIINVFGREEPLVNDDVLEREEPRIGGSFPSVSNLNNYKFNISF